MNKSDIMTIKAVLLYIINHSDTDRCDVYRIVKTAYYAQQMHFAEWAMPIFKDDIAALPFGPVPSSIYNILKLARGDDKVRNFMESGLDAVAAAIAFEDEYYSAKESPDMDFLSESDIECLDKAIEKVASMTFEEICADTHGDEWNRVRNNGGRFMDNLNIAREGGASEEAVEYLKDALELDTILG